MTFLKKLGSIIAQVAGAAVGFGPLLSTIRPDLAGHITKVTDSLSQAADIIVTVEAIGQVQGLPGADKLKIAGPLVAQAILKSDLLIGKKIEDHALFQRGAQKIADGLADVLNSLDEKDAQTLKGLAA